MGVENITKPVDSKFSRKEQPQTPEERFASLPNLSAGSEISLRKMSGGDNKGRALVGDRASGSLIEDVGIGKRVKLESGTTTTPVVAMEVAGDKIMVTTASGSVYELAAVGKDLPDNNQEQAIDWKTSLAQADTKDKLSDWIKNHPLEKNGQRLDAEAMIKALNQAFEEASNNNLRQAVDALTYIPSNSVREQALRVVKNWLDSQFNARMFDDIPPEVQKQIDEERKRMGVAPAPKASEQANDAPTPQAPESPNIATDQDPSLQSETVEVSQVLEQVEQHLDQQPESVKAFLEQFRSEFQTGCRVDGKNFIFTGLFATAGNHDRVVAALANDTNHPDTYNLRFFHCSGSDHQFKAYPGNDAGGSGRRHFKGKEGDPHHHYVQSGKLDARVIQEIQNAVSLSGSDEEKRPIEKLSGFIPKFDSLKDYKLFNPNDYRDSEARIDPKNENIRIFNEKFEFSEKQIELKNKKWQDVFNNQEKSFRLYGELSRLFQKYSSFNLDSLMHLVKGKISSPNIQEDNQLLQIFQRLDALVKDRFSVNREAALAEIHNITDYLVESSAQAEQMRESNLLPDFSQEPIRRYEKIAPNSKIYIEEFDVQSPEGDHLRWAMAHDDDGNVYVDNIYDPEVGIDDYGVPKLKLNAGLLVYKPSDYVEQTKHISEKYKGKYEGEEDDYININKYFQQQLPVKLYRESLINRGELQEENKTSSFPVGSELKVVKIDGANGEIKIGKEYSGTLKQPIEVGSIVDVSSITTSRVERVIPGNGKLVVETRSGSRYEISPAEEKSAA